jgi:hypothetical protein
MDESSPRRPWRRNPAAWLVIALPAATVIAGFVTLWLAASESGVDTYPDPVRRTAQVQVVALGADQAAASANMRARLTLDAQGTLLAVTPASGPMAPQLQLVHPIESTRDRVLALGPDPGGWRSREAWAGNEAWHVRLVAHDGTWRLVGRYRPGDSEVLLEPSVASQ